MNEINKKNKKNPLKDFVSQNPGTKEALFIAMNKEFGMTMVGFNNRLNNITRIKPHEEKFIKNFSKSKILQSA